MAKTNTKFEDLPEAAQKAVRKISNIRKVTLFISLAIGVIPGICFASRAYGAASKAGTFLLSFMLFCGMFQGAVHGVKVYKRLIRQHSVVGVLLSVIAIMLYGAIGGIFLAADTLLFTTGKPLIYPSEFNDIL